MVRGPDCCRVLLKVGNVGLWTIGGQGDDTDDADDNGAAVTGADAVFQFKPHTGSVPRLMFDPTDGNKLISTSYDGTVRRMDVEKGAFEQVKWLVLCCTLPFCLCAFEHHDNVLPSSFVANATVGAMGYCLRGANEGCLRMETWRNVSRF